VPAEVNGWLATGLSAGQAAQQVMNSSEYWGRQVQAACQLLLNGAPQPAEEAAWIAQAGMTENQFNTVVLTAPEFLAHHGADDPTGVPPWTPTSSTAPRTKPVSCHQGV
jgi:hypothetical protein